jgi:hypothetical protein
LVVGEALQIDATDEVSPRIIDDDSSHIAQGLHVVRRIWRNNCGAPGTEDSRLTGYCNLQLTIDDVPDLVVRMRMLMNPGTGFGRVVGDVMFGE